MDELRLRVALQWAVDRIAELEAELYRSNGLYEHQWAIVRPGGSTVMLFDNVTTAEDFRKRIYSECSVERVTIRRGT